MSFDPHINIGQIVQLIMLLGGAAVLYGRLVKIETKVEILFRQAMKRWGISEEEDED